MDDDLEEMRLIFLDECQENIELLEQGLMQMGDGDSSDDTLNEVFRAAHSIKGGAATFGFQPMSELTHHMETLLDEMRAHRREVCVADMDLLFAGLDIVLKMLEGSRDGTSDDQPDRIAMQEKLEASVSDASSGSEDSSDVEEGLASEEEIAEKKNWSFRFVPNKEFYMRGNDPLLLLSEVARLGDLSVIANTDSLPVWSEYDPTINYLAWEGVLTTLHDKSEVHELFEWVEDDCVLELSLIESPASAKPVDLVNATDVTQSQNLENDKSKSPATETATPPQNVAAEKESKDAVKTADKTENNVIPIAGKDANKKPAAPPKKAPSAANESGSIRIATDKIDQLINMVGELVITQSMLSRVGSQGDPIDLQELRERLADLEHHTRELQESVMQVRMLPIASAFGRLPRLVRDLSRKLDKDVDLILEGGTTELDKTVLERMIDPLVHLVRNSLDHGLETPAERVAAGKPEQGILRLSAKQESGSVIIEISDDGKGINGDIILEKARANGIVHEDDELDIDQINQLIFAPGFSTAEEVSDVSGRGVGMDVVRRNITDLGGRVHVHSQLGSGTRVEILLPLSLAILDGQLVRIADQTFVIPILSIVETLEVSQTEGSKLPNTGDVCRFRGAYLPTVAVAKRFGLSGESTGRMVVIVETHSNKTGLLVDDVLGQQQVVIKPLEKNYKPVGGLAGATIMSDGSVALILDPNGFGPEPKLADAA